MAYVDVDVDVVGCSYSKLVSGRHHTTSLLEQGNDTSHSHNCVVCTISSLKYSLLTH